MTSLALPILRQFVHDAVNCVKPLVDRLELLDHFPDRRVWLQEPEARRSAVRSLNALMQALKDIRTLAQCEQFQKDAWQPVDWKELTTRHIAPLQQDRRRPFRFEVRGSDFKGRADPDLIAHALDNLTWFAEHYSNRLIGITLKTLAYKGKPAVRLLYAVETLFDPGPDFGRCRPFFRMTEEKSSDLSETTGFLFFVVQQIAALHHGAFTARAGNKKATLEWTCPLNAGRTYG